MISISLLCKGQNKGTRKENCHGNYIPSGEGLSAAELTSTADASNGQVRPPAFAVSKRVSPAFYASLLLSGKIDEHLAEVENAAQAMMDSIMSRLKKERGITEELKANDQMQWVAEMENVRMGAEETVMNDLIWL